MRVVLRDVDATLLENGGRAGTLDDDAIRDVVGRVPQAVAPDGSPAVRAGELAGRAGISRAG